VTAPGLLTAQPSPDVARRSWPRYAALGAGMIGVAVLGAVWAAGGARLLLGAAAVFLVVRGAALLREGLRGLGAGAVVAGVLAAGAALVPGVLAGRVLLVAVPLLLLAGAAGLLARGGTARRGGLALLVWSLLVAGVLVATGLGQDWARAADVARVVTALAVAVLGVPVLLAALNLRALAARPAPAPRPAGCAGCACGAGGCGAG
jgi:hypothetical protein